MQPCSRSASNDTTVSNTGAAFDGATNVLTISDETGDVTVDLSGLSDTDTALGTDDDPDRGPNHLHRWQSTAGLCIAPELVLR